jgi:hypothetical protein
MRRVALLAVCLAVAGCAMSASDPPRMPLQASRKCTDVAQARMNDAAANGYDADDQQTIFRGTYDDCVQWEAKASTRAAR